MARIIAEFCQNHNGDRVLLGEMVAAAAGCGADFAKIQSLRSADLTHRPRFDTGLAEDGRPCIQRPYQTELARLRKLDLDFETQVWFVDQCHRAGIRPLTTVFTRGTVDQAARLGLIDVKVASYDCASYPLLEDLRGRFEHLFVSTGATTDAEIEKAAMILSRGSFSFLHCVTIYPTPLEQLHLARMSYLRQFTPSVGFSDHTLVSRDGNKASLAALSLGADIIERHFTILPSDRTKDGPVSIDPDGLRELVRFAHLPLEDVRHHVAEHVPEMPVMIGEQHRELTPDELLNRDYYRGRFASRHGDTVAYNWEEAVGP